ncbi:MAG: glycosyltransferase [Actinobacteria bacterium]|nr:glycosyltransferase [Actinomycetota bacterium]
MSKILILGMSPLPFENGKKAYGTGIRTWQFVLPLLEKGHEICLADYAVPSAYEKDFKSAFNKEQVIKGNKFIYNILTPKDFENISILAKIYREFNPDCIAGCTFYPSYVASKILSSLPEEKQVPFWADLFGHVMAEAQARAFMDASDNCLFHYWNSEFNILTSADIFSCVSQRQSYALAGELGAAGRLNMHTSGYDFARLVPCGMPDEDFVHEKNVLRAVNNISDDDFVVLWTGGYNTWTDVDTLYRGLIIAMEKNPKIKFVSTGGEIPEQDTKTYPHFLELINSGPFKSSFTMNGWINGRDVPNYYFEADIGINIDKDIYEVRLGSKNRILDWMRAGLCVLSSNVCELTEIIDSVKSGYTFKAHDYKDLADKLVYLSQHKDEVKKTAEKGRNYGRHHFNFNKTAESILKWAEHPYFAPDKFKEKKIFFEKEEALKSCNTIVENQKEMIKNKDERILELETLVKKNLIHKLYGYIKAAKRKLKVGKNSR